MGIAKHYHTLKSSGHRINSATIKFFEMPEITTKKTKQKSLVNGQWQDPMIKKEQDEKQD